MREHQRQKMKERILLLTPFYLFIYPMQKHTITYYNCNSIYGAVTLDEVVELVRLQAFTHTHACVCWLVCRRHLAFSVQCQCLFYVGNAIVLLSSSFYACGVRLVVCPFLFLLLFFFVKYQLDFIYLPSALMCCILSRWLDSFK